MRLPISLGWTGRIASQGSRRRSTGRSHRPGRSSRSTTRRSPPSRLAKRVSGPAAPIRPCSTPRTSRPSTPSTPGASVPRHHRRRRGHARRGGAAGASDPTTAADVAAAEDWARAHAGRASRRPPAELRRPPTRRDETGGPERDGPVQRQAPFSSPSGDTRCTGTGASSDSVDGGRPCGRWPRATRPRGGPPRCCSCWVWCCSRSASRCRSRLHEVGHMYAAKAFGMRVRRYFIGLRPEGVLLPPRRDRVRPQGASRAGGFCDIAGMTALDEVTPEEAPRAFFRKPTWQRVIVLLGRLDHPLRDRDGAGLRARRSARACRNLRNTPVVGGAEPVPRTRSRPTVAAPTARPGRAPSPPSPAGLQAGRPASSRSAGTPTPTWPDAVTAIRAAAGPTPVVVERGGQADRR